MPCSCSANTKDIRSMCCGWRRGQKNFWECRNAVYYFTYTMTNEDQERFGMNYNSMNNPEDREKSIFKAQTLKTALLEEFNCPKTRICDVMMEIMETIINNERDARFYDDMERERLELIVEDNPVLEMSSKYILQWIGNDTWCDVKTFRESYFVRIMKPLEWEYLQNTNDEVIAWELGLKSGVLERVQEMDRLFNNR